MAIPSTWAACAGEPCEVASNILLTISESGAGRLPVKVAIDATGTTYGFLELSHDGRNSEAAAQRR